MYFIICHKHLTFSTASNNCGRFLHCCLLASVDSSWKWRPQEHWQTECHTVFCEKKKNLNVKVEIRRNLKMSEFQFYSGSPGKHWEVSGADAYLAQINTINTRCFWRGLWKKCLFVFLSSSKRMLEKLPS